MSNPEPGSSEPQARAALGADFIIPALACALALYYFVSTTELVWEARATGTVIGLVVAGAVRRAVRQARAAHRVRASGASASAICSSNDEFNRQRLGLAAMVMVYVVTIYWVGATVGLFFLLIGCMWLLGVRSVQTLIGVALVAARVRASHADHLLDSKLPRGWIIDQFSPAPAS